MTPEILNAQKRTLSLAYELAGLCANCGRKKETEVIRDEKEGARGTTADYTVVKYCKICRDSFQKELQGGI